MVTRIAHSQDNAYTPAAMPDYLIRHATLRQLQVFEAIVRLVDDDEPYHLSAGVRVFEDADHAIVNYGVTDGDDEHEFEGNFEYHSVLTTLIRESARFVRWMRGAEQLNGMEASKYMEAMC